MAGTLGKCFNCKLNPSLHYLDLTSARRKMEDIISVLASIYNTNDRFIKEFQNILSERLLQATDFQVDREVGVLPNNCKKKSRCGDKMLSVLVWFARFGNWSCSRFGLERRICTTAR